ncbi:MAG: hypothetical protein WBQ24_02105, partial [Xanthobacteraceae bacterium]
RRLRRLPLRLERLRRLRRLRLRRLLLVGRTLSRLLNCGAFPLNQSTQVVRAGSCLTRPGLCRLLSAC